MDLNKASLSLFVVSITLLPIGNLTAVLRLVATRRSNRKSALEDWFSVCAWAILIIHDVSIFMGTVLPTPYLFPSVLYSYIAVLDSRKQVRWSQR